MHLEPKRKDEKKLLREKFENMYRFDLIIKILLILVLSIYSVDIIISFGNFLTSRISETTAESLSSILTLCVLFLIITTNILIHPYKTVYMNLLFFGIIKQFKRPYRVLIEYDMLNITNLFSNYYYFHHECQLFIFKLPNKILNEKVKNYKIEFNKIKNEDNYNVEIIICFKNSIFDNYRVSLNKFNFNTEKSIYRNFYSLIEHIDKEILRYESDKIMDSI